MRKNNITLIIKPTQECNLSCTYCYDKKEKNNIKNKIMPIETVKKIAKVVCNSFKNVTWTWHGGEPLLAGESFYREAHGVINEINNERINIKFNMQSNGTLYKNNKNWIDELGIDISFSYDFTNENRNRGNIDQSFINSAINVVDYDGSFKLVETYNKLVNSNKKTSFNKVFLENYSDEQIVEMSKNYCDLFDVILYDRRESVFVEREIFTFIDSILMKQDKTCNFTDCTCSLLSINPDGDIYMCDRFNSVNGAKYKFCNIDDIEFTILETFSSNIMEQIKKEQSEFRNQCKECVFDKFCSGICKANRIKDGVIDISTHDKKECLYRQIVFEHIFNKLFNLTKEDYSKINKLIYELLIENKFVPKFLIKEVEECLM